MAAFASVAFAPPCVVVTRGGGESPQSGTPSAKPAEKPQTRVPTAPKVPGKLRVRLRRRVEFPKGSGQYKAQMRVREWEVSRTAVIVCDMWDGHYCRSAAQRVDAMAPKMNRVITAARNHGVTIIHAPSGTMKVYAGTPFRLRMQQARSFQPPVPLQSWCYLDPQREGRLPIDDSQSPCDDPVVGPRVRKYTRQHRAIKMVGYDGVSDDGREIFNFLRQQGITNVAIMGVHTNKCVLGRPFGIRQLVRLGFHVALVRDLTDAMYDPRQYPYVSHARGTQLVVEHVEKFWCPSIESHDLTKVIPGSADPDAAVLRRARREAVGKR